MTRRDYALFLALLPLRLLALVVVLPVFVVGMITPVITIFVVLMPAEIVACTSPFVGLVSPRHGGYGDAVIEWGAEIMCRTMEVTTAPAMWIMDAVL